LDLKISFTFVVIVVDIIIIIIIIIITVMITKRLQVIKRYQMLLFFFSLSLFLRVVGGVFGMWVGVRGCFSLTWREDKNDKFTVFIPSSFCALVLGSLHSCCPYV